MTSSELPSTEDVIFLIIFAKCIYKRASWPEKLLCFSKVLKRTTLFHSIFPNSWWYRKCTNFARFAITKAIYASCCITASLEESTVFRGYCMLIVTCGANILITTLPRKWSNATVHNKPEFNLYREQSVQSAISYHFTLSMYINSSVSKLHLSIKERRQARPLTDNRKIMQVQGNFLGHYSCVILNHRNFNSNLAIWGGCHFLLCF